MNGLTSNQDSNPVKMTHKNTVKTRRAKENSAILEERQSQCTVERRSLLWNSLLILRIDR